MIWGGGREGSVGCKVEVGVNGRMEFVREIGFRFVTAKDK